MHVALDARHVQSSPIQPGLQLHEPHSHVPFSAPPHSRPWSRSHEKLSHSQYLPEITSSELLRLSHSHTPHTHCPLPLQSVNVVLSGRHPKLRSDSLCTSMLQKKSTFWNWKKRLHCRINLNSLRAFAIPSKVQFITFANAALVCSVTLAFRWIDLEGWVGWLFAWTAAQHLQVDD